MLLAVTGALLLGDWAEAATVVWLFAASQWLEVRTMERARDALRGVITLAPTDAVVKHDGHEHRMAGRSASRLGPSCSWLPARRFRSMARSRRGIRT